MPRASSRRAPTCEIRRDSTSSSTPPSTDYLGWGGKGVAGYFGSAGGRDLDNPGSQGLARVPDPKPKRFAVNYHLLRLGADPVRVRVQAWLDDDVNLWEDEPIPATLVGLVRPGCCPLASILWTALRGPVPFFANDPRRNTRRGRRPSAPSCSSRSSFRSWARRSARSVRCVLASRPQFDDLMDGLTFGVISGWRTRASTRSCATGTC